MAAQNLQQLPNWQGRLPFHPAFDGQVFYTIEPRPGDGSDDESNTAQTIGRMIEYACQDSANPIVRRAAFEATRQARDDSAIAAAIHAWIRSHVSFVPGDSLAAPFTNRPDQAQVLIRPIDLLTMPAPKGKCGDFSMLCSAMLRALGIGSSYKTIAADAEDPTLYSHVFVIADLPSGPFTLDCSHGPYPGWEVTPIGKTRLWPVEPQETHSMIRGLGDWTDLLSTPEQLAAEAIQNTPPGSDLSISTPSFDWTSLINTGLTDATKILGVRYAVPQLNPGQTISQTKNGTVMSQLPNGVTSAITSSANSGMLLMLAAVAFVAIFAFRK
jgi:hypothetical protein